jgi:hypothetical protein
MPAGGADASSLIWISCKLLLLRAFPTSSSVTRLFAEMLTVASNSAFGTTLMSRLVAKTRNCLDFASTGW